MVAVHDMNVYYINVYCLAVLHVYNIIMYRLYQILGRKSFFASTCTPPNINLQCFHFFVIVYTLLFTSGSRSTKCFLYHGERLSTHFSHIVLFAVLQTIECEVEMSNANHLLSKMRSRLTSKVDLEPCNVGQDEIQTIRLLDTDSISQTKEKLLDFIYRNRPVSLRPSITDIELGNDLIQVHV